VITEELDEWDSLGIGENSLGYGNGDAETWPREARSLPQRSLARIVFGLRTSQRRKTTKIVLNGIDLRRIKVRQQAPSFNSHYKETGQEC
jgi:hypothetical protein